MFCCDQNGTQACCSSMCDDVNGKRKFQKIVPMKEKPQRKTFQQFYGPYDFSLYNEKKSKINEIGNYIVLLYFWLFGFGYEDIDYW